jgi:hypothetical protein
MLDGLDCISAWIADTYCNCITTIRTDTNSLEVKHTRDPTALLGHVVTPGRLPPNDLT